MILPENVHEEPDTARSGADEADNCQAGVAKEAKAGLHAHQQGGADDERRENESGGDAISDFLKSVHQEMRFGRLHVDVELGVANRIQNFVQARGQGSNELLRFQQ